MVVESPLKIGFFRVGRVELLLKKKKTSHEKKDLKMRCLWGERDLTKQNREILGGKLCCVLLLLNLWTWSMLYHYYYAHVFLIINFVMLKFKDFNR